ncbi:MAG: symmetrical bis(5'-nucleosyl)-tetraphosphatase [Methylococcales bacterium]|jgi:bis(5'-nucleosyl)-tetraphosphatase (symmetrical)|nr:symmetrical bis(5'-nucleosyl)-tetraphosphatase [Methylococcales bacterium]MBT7408772.1 symmetrical bis(5'-nucleosyl)-tetraphosphatase [Methylococcales bacterium]
MSIYAIGDIQGCYDEFMRLLDLIKFDSKQDQLWLVGDLVNRGPKSLEVLRFIKGLGDESVITVLGNHDLHLLAIANGNFKHSKKSTLDAILKAPDCDELISWLRHRPVCHYDKTTNNLLIHAGLPPQWDVKTTISCAKELESALRNPDYASYFKEMYGNKPDIWSPKLTGMDRLRFITNCFTRLRFCTEEGKLMLNEKNKPGTQQKGMPWFQVPGRKMTDVRIIFGHWSALGYLNEPNLLAIDTGCLWGGKLTAQKIDSSNQCYSLDCNQKVDPYLFMGK